VHCYPSLYEARLEAYQYGKAGEKYTGLELGLVRDFDALVEARGGFFPKEGEHPGSPSMPRRVCAALKMGFRALRCAFTLTLVG
jgi:hypothetical protein